MYLDCSNETLEDLLEILEGALSCFALAIDDAVETRIWASLQELVHLMTLDKESTILNSGGRPR